MWYIISIKVAAEPILNHILVQKAESTGIQIIIRTSKAIFKG